MLQQRLDAVIDQGLLEKRVVGAVLLVARGGKLVYHRAAGRADREANRPVREDTVFRLASMTKPLVSAAALALVDAGKLSLEDPVTRWLPEFRPKLADGSEPTLTVWHLLTHTGGLNYGFLEKPGGPYHRLGVSDGIDRSVLSFAENLKRIAAAPLLSEPGKAWQYSLSTDVLGGVVARAGGASLPTVVHRLITQPLGMKRTAFTPPTDKKRLATPYADGKPQPRRMTEPYRYRFDASDLVFSPGRIFDTRAYPSGGGGMVGTASDYLHFLETLRTGGRPILRPETAKAMTTNAIGNIPVPAAGPGWGWGLGFAVLRDPAQAKTPQSPGTWQWGGVYGNSFWVDPQAKLSVVLLTNTAIAGMAGAFPEAIRRAVYAS